MDFFGKGEGDGHKWPSPGDQEQILAAWRPVSSYETSSGRQWWGKQAPIATHMLTGCLSDPLTPLEQHITGETSDSILHTYAQWGNIGLFHVLN